ncbi:MAG: galactose mutarotase [Lachnospiraceae bacterium]|nr:galactose mutarotase [Lachnospiraceae bacterium]
MGLKQVKWGTGFDSNPVSLFLLSNKNIEAEISNCGGLIRSLKVKDCNGAFCDVILGFDTVEEYKKTDSCMGMIVGRNCNRIADATFKLDDKEYSLVANDGNNNLHTGPSGTQFQTFEVDEELSSDTKLVLHAVNPEAEYGFPGNLKLTYTYTVTDSGFMVEVEGESDKDTVVNMTSHLYFNLTGDEARNLNWHTLEINSELYSELKLHMIPSGKACTVRGTCFDFTRPKPIIKDIFSDDMQMEIANGYDHNFIIKKTADKKKDDMFLAATASSDASGITMRLYTNTPGVQFYTANYLNEKTGKKGIPYGKRSGFCLEPQFPPNAINAEGDKVAKPILRAGEKYYLKILYEFNN